MASLATVTSSIKQKKAQLVSLIGANEEQVKRVLSVIENTQIRDLRADPKSMKFFVHPEPSSDGSHHIYLELYGAKTETQLSINTHALQQMGAKVEFPIGSYGKRLNVSSENEWRRGLLADNLNVLFSWMEFKQKKKGLPAQFLLRVVDGEARGFLTMSFARHLDSRVLLNAFLTGCASVGAVPTDARVTSVKYSITAFLPTVYEPVPLSYAAFGIRWTTSDFGAGQMELSPVILLMHAKMSSAVLEGGLARRHVGARLQSDDDDIELSRDTILKQVEAERSRIQDVINAKLAPDAIKRYLKFLKRAHEENIPWDQLQGQLSSLLTEDEKSILADCLDNGFSELPPPGKDAAGQLLPSKMWAASLLSWFASKCDDPDRKAELEIASGMQIESTKRKEDDE